MRELAIDIMGTSRPIHVPEFGDDFGAIVDAITACDRPIAVDVETTGLDTFCDSFRCRSVQFATLSESWVVQVDKGGFDELVRDVLGRSKRLLAHHAVYDITVLDRFGFGDYQSLWRKMTDTRILAHLLDPRSIQDGAVGHKLEALAAFYLGDPHADRFNVTLKEVFKVNKWKIGEGYAKVDLDDPVFIRYGAADVFLTAWLFEAIYPLVESRGFSELVSFEHEIARICCGMQRKGILVDTEYAAEYGAHLSARAEAAAAVAARYGVSKVNSGTQVAEALVAMGAELHLKTTTGKLKVDKDVLEGLHGHEIPAVRKLAFAVSEAKSSGKFRTTYVDGVVDGLDSAGRSHPWIHSLQARTARMSISGPPLQQIPAGDWRTRRMFVADPGQVICAADYSQVELRMLGALADERNIFDAVRDGVDLHDLTAKLVGCSRKMAKMVNFLIVYGGGAKTLSARTGISLAEARKVIKGFKRAYPAVERYAKRLVEQSEMGKLNVTTATGRELPLDRSRVFAATNYTVQSSARDILGQALIDIDRAGLSEHLLLPVHDEVIVQAPIVDASEVIAEISSIMSMNVLGMRFDAEGEVYGKSWGHGYAEDSEMIL